MKKYIAEFIGTFALTLAVALSLAGVFPVSTPVVAALTLGLFVYSVGHISGTHINPAVTVGLWSIGKIKSFDAVGYLVAQFAGAYVAYLFSGIFIEGGLGLTAGNSLLIGGSEALGTFFFVFGIASVIYGRTPSVMSGLVVGGSLLLGISLAAIASNGVLNPAVALGIGSFSWMYLLGPIIGSTLGMWMYRVVSE